MRRDGSENRHKYNYADWRDLQRKKLADSNKMAKGTGFLNRMKQFAKRRAIGASLAVTRDWGAKHTDKIGGGAALIAKARADIERSKAYSKHIKEKNDKNYLKHHDPHRPKYKHTRNGKYIGSFHKPSHYHPGRSMFKRMKEWGYRRRKNAYLMYKTATQANRHRSTSKKAEEHNQHAATILSMDKSSQNRALSTLGIGSAHQRQRLVRAHTGKSDAKWEDLSAHDQSHLVSRVVQHRGLSQAVSALEGMRETRDLKEKQGVAPHEDEAL
jgi:hypothetical protein